MPGLATEAGICPPSLAFIAGASFGEVHAPVPGFAESAAANDSMVRTMVERGPYVRFVWTLSADDHLDHHPDEGRRRPWSEGGSGWLRVERQVSVPFPRIAAANDLVFRYATNAPTLRVDGMAVAGR